MPYDFAQRSEIQRKLWLDPEVRARRTRKRGDGVFTEAGYKADAGYHGIHIWMRRRYPKSGTCDHCNQTPPRVNCIRRGKQTTKDATVYAFMYHPEPYTRNREDYLELCWGCHLKFDENPISFPAEKR